MLPLEMSSYNNNRKYWRNDAVPIDWANFNIIVYTVRCRYDEVHIIQYPYNRHPIASP